MGIVRAQDRERLAHGLRLLRASLRPLLELLVRHLARLLQVHEELLVSRKTVARVLQILLRLRVRRIRVGELLRLRVLLVRAGLDLCFLASLEILVSRLALPMFGLTQSI